MSDADPATVDPERVRVGVSACLVGQKVRYDGDDKFDPTVAESLAHHFELVTFCPEVAIGLGVPRPPIHLRGDPDVPRVLGNDDPSLEVTEALADEGERMAARIGGLSGYIFKGGSPSCGVDDVPVFADDGGDTPAATGTGRYAAAIRAERPLLPIETESRLADTAVRDQFVLRVGVFHRWQCLRAAGVRAADLTAFHAAHKYLLLAHDPERSRAMARLISDSGARDVEAVADAYGRELMAALAEPPGRRAHYNALQHSAGHLRGRIGEDEWAHLHAAIERYFAGDAPLSEPMALLRRYGRRSGSDWLARQHYLDADGG